MLVAKKKEYYQEPPKGKKIQGKAKVAKTSLYTKKRIKLGPMFSLVFLACIIVSVVLSYVAIHATMARTAYLISETQKEMVRVQNENELLQLQIMNLTALDRIEKVARNKLQMAGPEDVQFVALPKELSEKNDFPAKVPESKKRIHQKAFNVIEQVYQDLCRQIGDTMTAEAGTF